MTTIGFDLSLNGTGICILTGTSFQPKAEFILGSKQPGNFYQRLRIVENMVKEVVVARRPEIIGIEAPIVGQQMTEMAWALYVLSLRVIDEFARPCLVVCPANTSVKSIYFGKMGVTKTEIRDKAKQELGISGKFSADEADAYFIAKVAFQFHLVLTSGPSLLSYLTDKEKHVYLSEEFNSKGLKKGIKYREGDLYYDWRMKDGIVRST